MSKCTTCGTALKELFTSTYCPNQDNHLAFSDAQVAKMITAAYNVMCQPATWVLKMVPGTPPLVKVPHVPAPTFPQVQIVVTYYASYKYAHSQLRALAGPLTQTSSCTHPDIYLSDIAPRWFCYWCGSEENGPAPGVIVVGP